MLPLIAVGEAGRWPWGGNSYQDTALSVRVWNLRTWVVPKGHLPLGLGQASVHSALVSGTVLGRAGIS